MDVGCEIDNPCLKNSQGQEEDEETMIILALWISVAIALLTHLNAS